MLKKISTCPQTLLVFTASSRIVHKYTIILTFFLSLKKYLNLKPSSFFCQFYVKHLLLSVVYFAPEIPISFFVFLLRPPTNCSIPSPESYLEDMTLISSVSELLPLLEISCLVSALNRFKILKRKLYGNLRNNQNHQ